MPLPYMAISKPTHPKSNALICVSSVASSPMLCQAVCTTITYKQSELNRDDPYWASVLVLNFRDRDFIIHVSVTLINTILGLEKFTIRDFAHGGPDEYVDVEEVDPAFVPLLTQIRDEALNHLPPMVRVSGVRVHLPVFLTVGNSQIPPPASPEPDPSLSL